MYIVINEHYIIQLDRQTYRETERERPTNRRQQAGRQRDRHMREIKGLGQTYERDRKLQTDRQTDEDR